MLEKKKKIDTHFQFSVWYISFLWKLGHNYICKQRFAKHRLHMFDTNFISVLYFEWWARLPSAWLQVQSLLGVSEECLNLLSVSKNHHHIKKEQIHKSCKSCVQDNMIFSKDSDSYSPFTLHVQGKTCCVILPPCHFAFKKQKKGT